MDGELKRAAYLGLNLVVQRPRFHQNYSTRQEVTTTTVTFPSTSRDVLSGEKWVITAREAGEDYRWSRYHAHGRGETNELLDRLATYEELSPYPAVRQRKWSEQVHEVKTRRRR